MGYGDKTLARLKLIIYDNAKSARVCKFGTGLFGQISLWEKEHPL